VTILGCYVVQCAVDGGSQKQIDLVAENDHRSLHDAGETRAGIRAA
jgi:hypothetical protein